MILFLLVVADYLKGLALVYLQKYSLPGKLRWCFVIMWAVSKCRWHSSAKLPSWALIGNQPVLYAHFHSYAPHKAEWQCLLLAVKKSAVLSSSLAHDGKGAGFFLFLRGFKPRVWHSWRKAVAWHLRMPPGVCHLMNLNTSLSGIEPRLK